MFQYNLTINGRKVAFRTLWKVEADNILGLYYKAVFMGYANVEYVDALGEGEARMIDVDESDVAAENYIPAVIEE